MGFLDSRDRYGWMSILLHWLSALAVLTLLVVGLMFSYETVREERRALLALHISIGVLAWTLLFARVLWRVTFKGPDKLPQPKLYNALSVTVQKLLLVTVLVQIISGPLVRWSSARALEVFDWFAVPSPLSRMEGLHEAMEVVHKYNAYVMLALIALHLAGVLKHIFIDRDHTLDRMLGRG